MVAVSYKKKQPICCLLPLIVLANGIAFGPCFADKFQMLFYWSPEQHSNANSKVWFGVRMGKPVA